MFCITSRHYELEGDIMNAVKWEMLTPETIANETYHNLCQLSDLTGYAMPHTAYAKLQLNVAVWKDAVGNIVRLA